MTFNSVSNVTVTVVGVYIVDVFVLHQCSEYGVMGGGREYHLAHAVVTQSIFIAR